MFSGTRMMMNSFHSRPWVWVLSLVGGVLGAPALQGQGPNRITITAETLDWPQCVAQPGNVPLPGGPGPNVEIVGWQTTPTVTNQAGEFVLRFTTNLVTATLFTYDAGDVFCSVSNAWQPLPAGRDAGRRLQVRPFPGDRPVSGLKIVVPAQAETNGPKPAYRATLPFAMVAPVRAIDISKDATVTANFGPAGRAIKELTDGAVDPVRNFAVARPTPLASSNVFPWVLLSWEQTQSVRGLAFYCGREETGLGEAMIEGCISAKAPREVTETQEWSPPSVRVSEPGRFRSNQFAVVMHEFFTRGVRIRSTNEVGEISLGEVLVFTAAPTPGAATREATKAPEAGGGTKRGP